MSRTTENSTPENLKSFAKWLAASLAFVAPATTLGLIKAGTRMITEVNMSDCDTSGNHVQGPQYTTSCDAVKNMDPNAQALPAVTGCYFDQSYGPYTAQKLLEKFCTPELVQSCSNYFLASFTPGTKEMPYSKDGNINAVGTYCEKDVNFLLGLAAAVLLVFSAYCLMKAGKSAYTTWQEHSIFAGNRETGDYTGVPAASLQA